MMMLGQPPTVQKEVVSQEQVDPICLSESEPSYSAPEFCTPSIHLICCRHHTDKKQWG